MRRSLLFVVALIIARGGAATGRIEAKPAEPDRPLVAAGAQLPSALATELDTLHSRGGSLPDDRSAGLPEHRLGLRPSRPTTPPQAQRVLGERSRWPASADNSSGLPPIGNQGQQGSCVSWAVGYYISSYQEGLEHGWSLTDPDHQLSPRFLYNQLQYYDEGTTVADNVDLVLRQGCASLADEPYDDLDFRTFPAATSYRNAIPFRAASADYLGHGETPHVFDAIKTVVADGNLVVIGIPIYRAGPGLPGRFDLLSPGDDAYHQPAAEDTLLAGFHAVTIVGYDETAFSGQGGYKVVNQWGDDWGSGGFAWLSEAFLTSFGLDFYRLVDRSGYQPEALVHVNVFHSYWGGDYQSPEYDDVAVTVGTGPIDDPTWSKVLLRDLPGVDRALEVDLWADVSEGVDHLPATPTNPWWIRIEDHWREDQATLLAAELELDGTTQSAQAVLPWVGPFFPGNLDLQLPVGPAAGPDYFVNDDSTAGDQYCTAVGDDANDGLTPATPKRTVQAVLDAYAVVGGDTIWIDSGSYPEVSIDFWDRGNALNGPVTLRGARGPDGDPVTTIQASTSDVPSIDVMACEHLTVRDLTLTGGSTGLSGLGNWKWLQDEHLTLEGLHVTDVAADAIHLYEMQAVAINRCLLHDWGSGFGVYMAYSGVDADRCTVAAPADQSGFRLVTSSNPWLSGSGLDLSNSIVTASGAQAAIIAADPFSQVSSQYSTFLATSGAAPPALGAGDQLADPLFADPASEDFHLQSAGGRWQPGPMSWTTDATTSPAVDGGDPSIGALGETVPNGGRLNQGAYAGTTVASRSPDPLREITVLAPQTGGSYSWQTVVSWSTVGDGWQAGDTIQLEYSDDDGATWSALPGAAAVAYDAAVFSWSLDGLSSGDQYQLRATCNQQTAATDTTGSFSIVAGTTYYVNDAATSGDVYCTAPGSAANDGLAPATPVDSVQAIVDTYDLEPGDRVLIDSGSYSPAATIMVPSEDSGDDSAPLRFVGSSEPDATVIDGHGFTFDRAHHVHLESVVITNAAANAVALSVSPGSVVSGCRLSNATNSGVDIYGTNGAIITGCRIDHNDLGVRLFDGDNVVVDRCTLVHNDRAQVRVGQASAALSLSNSIIWADGPAAMAIEKQVDGFVASSDFNNLYATGGALVAVYDGEQATLSAWNATTGFDGNSLSAAPELVDLDGADDVAGTLDDDLHLASSGGSWHDGTWTADGTDSPCLDAGDPAAYAGPEPAPNGGRLNLGAFAGSAQASRSPSGRAVALMEPNGAETWSGAQTIRWSVIGSGWQTGDTVEVAYSPDDGASWTVLASGVDAALGSLLWDTSAASPDAGTRFRVRVRADDEPTVRDSSEGPFTLRNQPLQYWVNDASSAGDVYCSAVGNDGNDGLDPATPKATVQAVLDTYDLEPGDTVWIDTGTYALTQAIEIGQRDAGSSEGRVRLVGSTVDGGTVIDRGSTVQYHYGIHVIQAPFVSLERLTVTGAWTGIHVYGSADVRIARCRLFANSENGLSTDVVDRLEVTTTVADHNGSHGLFLYKAVDPVIDNLTAVDNGFAQIETGYGTGNMTLTESILVATGSSDWVLFIRSGSIGACDHNLYRVTGSANAVGIYISPVFHANLDAWQSASGFDLHSIESDPLFVDPDGADSIAGTIDDDYHLQSTAGSWHGGAWTADAATSPAVDHGNPSADPQQETAPNGGRRNAGAYGGTEQASHSPSGRQIRVRFPNGGEQWSATRTIGWHAAGDWSGADRVRLEYSADAGASWHLIPDAEAREYLDEAFAWDTTTAIPDHGAQFLVRATAVSDASVSDRSDGQFSLRNQPLGFFVNDNDTAADVYCSAVGDDTNDALSPATPKRTIQAVLDTYDLEPGDTIWIDTGTYVLSADIEITDDDQGSADGFVTLHGSTRAGGTVLDRSDTTATTSVVHIVDAQFVRLRDLWLTGGHQGLYTTAEDGFIERCRIFANAGRGVFLQSAHSNRLQNLLIDGNQGTAIELDNAGGTVVQNTTVLTDSTGIASGNYSGLTLTSSIVWADGAGASCLAVPLDHLTASDWNDLHATSGAEVAAVGGGQPTLADWQGHSGEDGNSLSVDPLFVDADGADNTPATDDDDLHLQSTTGSWHDGLWTADGGDSPCIDAGDPSIPIGDESTPTGGVVNQGAYGASEQASRSRQLLVLTAPTGGERLSFSTTVSWQVNHLLWPGSDTVTVSYSPNDGTDWFEIASGVLGTTGAVSWDLSALDRCGSYLVRVVHDQNAADVDTSEPFTVARTYFVNDGSTDDDVYCSAVGSAGNDGLSPASPLDRPHAILDSYDLEPGDLVLIDAGSYSMTSDLWIGAADAGSAAAAVTIQGAGPSTVLDRNDPATAGTSCFEIDAGHVSVEELTCRNAWIGAHLVSSAAAGTVLEGLQLSGCGERAILVDDAQQVTLRHLAIHHSGSQAAVMISRAANLDTDVELDHLTVSAAGVGALNVAARSGVSLRSSILTASGDGVALIEASWFESLGGSDFNNLVATDGAVVGRLYGMDAPLIDDYRALSYSDANSLSVEPLFADSATDLHLLSQEGRWDPVAGSWQLDPRTSPCIDAADPTEPIDGESAPNGARTNLGAYGGTGEASRSPASSRWLAYLGTGRAGEPLHGIEPVRWAARGSAWGPAETVSLELSANAGGSWQAMSGGSNLGASAGIVWWDTRTVADGTYLLRITADSPPLASTDSGRDLTVLNDAVPVGDVDGDGALDVGDIMAIVQREADLGIVLDGDPYCLSRDGLEALWCVLERLWLIW